MTITTTPYHATKSIHQEESGVMVVAKEESLSCLLVVSASSFAPSLV